MNPVNDNPQYIACIDGRPDHLWDGDRCAHCGTGRGGDVTSDPAFDNRTTDSYDPRPSITFSDVAVGKPFFGEVTSKRTGVTTRGIFVKIAHRALLIENASDHESGTDAALNEEPPDGRYIRPETVVLILWTPLGQLPVNRVPLMLDNLDVRDLCYLDLTFKFKIPSLAVREEIRKAEQAHNLADLLGAIGGLDR